MRTNCDSVLLRNENACTSACIMITDRRRSQTVAFDVRLRSCVWLRKAIISNNHCIISYKKNCAAAAG